MYREIEAEPGTEAGEPVDGMSETEWSLPAVLDVVTAAVPDREMVVWKSTRRTFADVAERTRRLGAFFQGRGLGARRERPDLERWECGQSTVAILLSNCPEYLEAMVGSFRARAVPVNVNHHYNRQEVASLLDQIDVDAVVYHRRLAPLLAPAAGGRLLVHVDDGSDVVPLPGSVSFADALAEGGDVGSLPAPSPDDLYLVCTGGTTGKPKGVLWRQADMYVSCLSGIDGASAEQVAADAVAGAGVWFAASPLMHAAAQWTAFTALHRGGTVVLHEDAHHFDAQVILETAARERAMLLTIVGDAYARPMVAALRSGRYDLSALAVIGTGGAITSTVHRDALLESLPHIVIRDGYGASESGAMGAGVARKGEDTRHFQLAEGGAVLSADRSRFLRPGEDEIGWVARTGRVPLGYLNDRERTERTFPVIDGQRVAIPGDRATIAADGSLVMLGRDAMVINTGGEKVFVEEVEEAIRRHPDVLDALVVGRPHQRFGDEVVAIVQARPGSDLTPRAVREFTTLSVARFKAPRAVVLCDRIRRHPTGKPDYTWARGAARDAVSAVQVSAMEERGRRGGDANI
jgi:acyl-CoA synthetase (AMP-forming)/AMP-acid ligase II